jgi:hypothetical protein
MDSPVLHGEIAGYIRDAAHAVLSDRHMKSQGIDRWLNVLGWGPIDLDDHTLQRLVASLNREDARSDTSGFSEGV